MQDIIIPLAGMATGLLMVIPLVRVLGRYLERKAAAEASPEELRAMRDELRHMLDKMDHQGDRITELEERLEFTERLLTKAREEGGRAEGPEGGM